MGHHFADDTNVTFSHKSLKKVNEFIDHDLSLLVQLLHTNRISLNTSTKNKNITKNFSKY